MIKRFIKELFSLKNVYKTLFINFKTLPFCQAIHLPIYCDSHVTLKGLKRGSIVIACPVQKRLIDIGLDAITGSALGGIKHKHTYLRFGKGSRIVFKGKGGFASGNSIVLMDNAKLVLGKDFSTNVLCDFFVYKKIEFGEDCFLGWNVSLRDGDGHYVIERSTGEILNHPEEIHIGNHVWLCSGVTVMKGVNIADDCVVAGNSLVLRSLTEEHSIYGGVPAKLLKRDRSFIKDGRGYK